MSFPLRSSTLLRSAVLACVLALGGSVSVEAQSRIAVRGNVGASFFQSPESLSQILNSGVSLGIGGGVRVWRGLSVTVRGGYDQFTLNEQILGPEGGSGELSFYSGSLGLRYTYENATDAHPYVDVGGGRYQLNQSGQLESATITGTGVNVALGSLLRLNDTYALFFEGRYDFYLDEDLPETLRYFTLRLGVDVQF